MLAEQFSREMRERDDEQMADWGPDLNGGDNGVPDVYLQLLNKQYCFKKSLYFTSDACTFNDDPLFSS